MDNYETPFAYDLGNTKAKNNFRMAPYAMMVFDGNKIKNLDEFKSKVVKIEESKNDKLEKNDNQVTSCKLRKDFDDGNLCYHKYSPKRNKLHHKAFSEDFAERDSFENLNGLYPYILKN